MALDDQIPLETVFDAKNTASEVISGIDLKGKNAVITGGYSGIGLETLRAIAGAGARVFVPVRDAKKGHAALSGIKGDVHSLPMDLSDLTSVQRFAAELGSTLGQLDLLINNAGVMASPLSRVGPGWESQFGICHMGHFALTQALMPLLTKTSGARVVALSSTAHKISDVIWGDVHFQNGDYDKWRAYGQAKTANALFANALSRRLRGSEGLAFSVHPGGIFTPLQRHLPKEEMIALGWLDADGEPSELAKAGFKSPEQGAATTVWAATSPLLTERAGVYCEDVNIAAPTNPESPTARYFGVDAHACDDESAERLWDVSNKWLEAA